MLSKEFLDILACPICKKAIKEEGSELICSNCQKAYPIKDGIPVMMINEARDLNKEKQP